MGEEGKYSSVVQNVPGVLWSSPAAEMEPVWPCLQSEENYSKNHNVLGIVAGDYENILQTWHLGLFIYCDEKHCD